MHRGDTVEDGGGVRDKKRGADGSGEQDAEQAVPQIRHKQGGEGVPEAAGGELQPQGEGGDNKPADPAAEGERAEGNLESVDSLDID